MRKKSPSNYELLKDVLKKDHILKKKSAIENFNNVNNCIEIILKPRENDPIVEIKSLICQFEGKLFSGNYYAVITIAYALLIALIHTINEPICEFFLILAAIFGVVLCAIGIKNSDYKNTFILKALNFKLDELNKKSMTTEEIGTENDADKKNKTGTADEQDEKRNCKKYVVRVYDK